MAQIGLIFPGQGSQTVGMGRELIESSSAAKAVFAQADSALGMPLSRLVLEGPEDELKRTDMAQPAILTASIAAWAALQERGLLLEGPTFLGAGHSLGEYSALVAAGALDFASAVRLVRQRGQWMLEASAAIPGGGSMTAIIGCSVPEVEALCQSVEGGQVQIANLNCPGQVVVSGSNAGLAKLSEIAKAKKLRVMPLAVSGPFHSRYMEPAAQRLQGVLDQTVLQKARFPVVANFSAKAVEQPQEVREALFHQVAGSVRWEDSIRVMLAQGVSLFIEIGPGRVLRGLMKKIAPEAKSIGAFTPDEVQIVVSELALMAASAN